MKRLMIVLGIGLIFCGMLAGCKEKNREEQIEALTEKLGEAKTEEEAEKIANRIEKLEQEIKEKKVKGVWVKLGEPFTFWQQVASGSQEMTQFSMTFKRVAVAEEPIVSAKETGKKYLMVLARTKNLGPRKAWCPPSGQDIQIKTKEGDFCQGEGYPASDFFSSAPPFPLNWKALDSWTRPFGGFNVVDRFTESLEREEIGWNIYWVAIPEDSTPIEVSGQFPTEPAPFGGKKMVRFRLKLTQFSEKDSIKEKTEKEKERARENSGAAALQPKKLSPKPKTIYDIWKEDEKRLAAEPEPKELSSKDKIQEQNRDKNVIPKWTHEEIGNPPGIFSDIPDTEGGGGIQFGSRRPGPKVSKDGIFYVDVVGPEGPKLYAIDVISGKILKSKDLKSDHYLLGISQKAIYLAPFVNGGETRSLLVLDRINLALLWEKDLEELGACINSFWLTERGVLCAGGLIDEVTGEVQAPGESVEFIRAGANLVVNFVGRDIIFYEHRIGEEGPTIITLFDLSTRKVLWERERFYGQNIGLYETADKFFAVEGNPFHISCSDINTGQVKWETEKLVRTYFTKLAGVTKEVVIIYGEVRRESHYTLWYGIDAENGKVLWEKWARPSHERDEPLNPFCMGGDFDWTKIVNGILLIGKFDQLVLVDVLTGEVLAQENDFPRIGRYKHAAYKDRLIVGLPNGLRCYQIKGYDGKREGETKVVSEKKIVPNPNKEISEVRLPGKYILEEFDSQGSQLGKEPGLMIFQEDGSIMGYYSGRWAIEGKELKLYEENQKVGNGKLSTDTIADWWVYDVASWQTAEISKKDGAEIVKAGLGILLWSDYVFPGNKSFALELKKDGTFSMKGLLEERWKSEKGLVQIYKGQSKTDFSDGKIEGNNIIFKLKDGLIRLKKQEDV